METEHLLMIGMIISTMIAPSLAVVAKSLLYQKKLVAVDQSRPKNRIRRIYSWLKSHWLILIGILVAIASLIREFTKNTPINRGSILIITMAVGLFNFLLIVWMIISILNLINRLVSNVEQILTITEKDQRLFEEVLAERSSPKDISVKKPNKKQ